MKKHLICLSVIFVFTVTIQAKSGFGSNPRTTHTIRLGFYGPSDAKSGFTIGYNFGKAIDEMVSVGIGGDLYLKNYIKETTVATADTLFSGAVQTIERESDFSSYLLPLHGNITVTLPMDYSGFRPVITGGIGLSFLLNREVNYLTDDTENRFFTSFTWSIGSGMKYTVGSNSEALFELYYHRANLKSDRGKTEAGLPVYNEINMSGLGLRVGLVLEI